MTTLPPIANRIARIKRGEDPQLIARMPAFTASEKRQIWVPEPTDSPQK